MSGYNSWYRFNDTSNNSSTSEGDSHGFDTQLSSVPPKRVGQWLTLANGHKYRRSTAYARFSTVIQPGYPQFGVGRWYETSRAKWHTAQVESSPGGWRFDFATGAQLYSAWSMPEIGLTISGINQNPKIPTASSNEATVKALNDLAQSKANMGENLGTLSQTLRLICNPAKALAGSLRSVYQNKSLRPLIRESLLSLRHKGIHTRAAEKYLEYVYGWKPLMEDIYGLVELAQAAGDLPLFVTGRGKAKRTQAPAGGVYSEPSFKSKTAITGGSFDSTVRCKLTAMIDPNHSGTRALNQLGLANPVATAWELVTWSFVFDWFVPVGPVLNAMSAPAGLTFVNGSRSNRVSGVGTFTSRWTGADNKIASSDGSGTVTYEGYVREEVTTWPRVGFWVDPDPFRADRLLKATALAIANIRTLD